jgi:hypothetical protein
MIPIDSDNLRDLLMACIIVLGSWGLIQLFH